MPKGMQAKITYLGGGKAVFSSADTFYAKSIRLAYEEVFKRPCGNILAGGSIPIVDKLKKYTKDHFILMGLALSSDNIHAPNEEFDLSRIEKGIYIIANIIDKMATDV